MNHWTTRVPLALLLTACASTPTLSDLDGDGIADVHEGAADPDGDGIPALEDDDSDGDGILDVDEAGDGDLTTFPSDSDGDGQPDFLDLDADGNCIDDADERGDADAPPLDSDGDGRLDAHDTDDDGDGLTDIEELWPGACIDIDTDDDGTPDRLDLDSDADGLPDVDEAVGLAGDTPADTDGDGVFDFRDEDSDDDGFTDWVESQPEPRDTDGDGVPDHRDIDSDGDGLSDRDEDRRYGTDPYGKDSDGDGQSDAAELAAGADPNDPEWMIPGHFVTVRARDDVAFTEEFELSLSKVDVVFLVAHAMVRDPGRWGVTSWERLAAAVPSVGDDLAVSNLNPSLGIVTTQSYGLGWLHNYDGTGSFGTFGAVGIGGPLLNSIPLADWKTTALRFAALQLPNEEDVLGSYGSMLETLSQLTEGRGFDLNCDGTYDPPSDVLPWRASTDDPFGGLAGQRWTGEQAPGTAFGFRRHSLQVFVMVSQAGSYDPDHPDPYHSTFPVTGCPEIASSSQVLPVLRDRGAVVVGIVPERITETGSSWGYHQFIDWAERTDSLADLDGDGERDDPLVFSFDWFTEDPKTEEVTAQLADAIQAAVASRRFDTVSLEIQGDEHGFAQDISPASIPLDPDDPSPEASFTIHLRGVVAPKASDQVFRLDLVALGDGKVELDRQDIVVLVPGEGL